MFGLRGFLIMNEILHNFLINKIVHVLLHYPIGAYLLFTLIIKTSD